MNDPIEFLKSVLAERPSPMIDLATFDDMYHTSVVYTHSGIDSLGEVTTRIAYELKSQELLTTSTLTVSIETIDHTDGTMSTNITVSS